ncbi:MAG: sigma 54-interacting transcriptional regulator [Acidobacteriota bacterium]
MKNNLDLIAKITESVSRSRGIHAESKVILSELTGHVEAPFGFVCLDRPEAARMEIVAAAGLDASNFRRLETRAHSSLLSEVIREGLRVTIKSGDDDLLDFLFDKRPERRIVSVPLILSGTCIGSISLAFDDTSIAEGEEVLTLLDIAAGMIARTLRVENFEREESRKLIEENSHLKQELKEKYDFSNLIGNSSPMRQVYEQVTQVARSNATVLLRGESGTGKEMIAHAIHYNSLRSKRPFVKVNCAALPDSLIESELFGHEKGAFTGADRIKKGRFEIADGGTLFLDEIGDLPPQTQIKLLRVLQEREFERLGGTETIKTNIRLITATNRNLEDAIATGIFREDLFYRLNVFTIFLPPLRDRKSDILLLAEHFLEKYEAEHDKRIRRISTPAIDMLAAYHFPGNVRELENVIERAVIVCDSNVIHGHHLPPSLQTAEVSGTVTRVTLASAVAAFERDLIQDTLKSSGGNVARAAKMLDSTERILGYKIKKYGIDTIRFRR